jgi:hypothetical protein
MRGKIGYVCVTSPIPIKFEALSRRYILGLEIALDGPSLSIA